MIENLELKRSVLESDNLVEGLSDQELRDIGNRVVSMVTEDKESRAEWEEQNDRWMKLATQVMEAKDHPWPNAANIKYPLLSTAALQFHARAYPAMINDGRITKPKVIGQATQEKNKKAQRTSLHMNWQLMEQMDEWQEDMDRMLYVLPIIGLTYKKTYFSPIKGRNVSQMLLPRDVIINYHAEDYERATKTHRMYLD
jgi:chaperonin GroES